jgi:hypothetical protein
MVSADSTSSPLSASTFFYDVMAGVLFELMEADLLVLGGRRK